MNQVFTSSKTGEISKDGPQRNCRSISQVSVSSANLSIKIFVISWLYCGYCQTEHVRSDSRTGLLTHALQVVPLWSHPLVPHKTTCTEMAATCNVSAGLYEPCSRILHQMLQGLEPDNTDDKKMNVDKH